MVTFKTQLTCDLCGKTFEHTPGRELIPVEKFHLFDMGICRYCSSGNEDGWSPNAEKEIINHLNKNELPVPDKNKKGYLPYGKTDVKEPSNYKVLYDSKSHK